MKLIRTYRITAEDFYSTLEEEIIKDVKKSTGRDIKAKDIKTGFKYYKNPNDKFARITIQLKEYERGKKYCALATSYGDEVEVKYDTRETDKGLYIEFDQHIKSLEAKDHKSFSYKYHKFFHMVKMSSSLSNMATGIIKKKEGIVEKKPFQNVNKAHDKLLKAVIKHEEKKK